ncbi:MAG TPA: WD40 repeat domain-containing protein, partial [Gemmataceae bacterium]|nr:WD40 repeat domain-containing protein [Gemmataceae bacterium]
MALSFDAWKPGQVRPATVEVPVHVITAAESPQLRATLKGHEEVVWQVAWAPDGRTLASLSVIGGEARLWDVTGRKERATLRSEMGNSYGMAFAPDGKTLLVGRHRNDPKAGPTGGVELWDVASGQRKGLLRHTPPRGVTWLALAPDGKLLVAAESWKEGEKGEYKSCLTLWDVGGGKAVTRLADEPARALAFSPDGQSLAWDDYVRKGRQITAVLVRRRDLAKQQDLPPLPNKAGLNGLACLAYSPDGRTLAGADHAGNVLLWDTASAKVRATLKPEGGRRVSSLAFSPDGKTLAAAVGNRPGRDREPGLIVLWDAATGKQRLTLTGHTNEALSVAFSPDGKLLASGSSDR